MATYFLANLPRRELLERLKAAYPGMDVDAVEAYNAVLRTAHDWLERTDRDLRRRGLSQAKLRILAAIHRSDGGCLAPHEIAEQLAVTRPTVTGLLSGLERDGLIERESSREDLRRQVVRLSARGRKVVEPLFRERLQMVQEAMSTLDRSEKVKLVQLLSRLGQA